MTRTRLLGVSVDAMTSPQVQEALRDQVREGEGCLHVVTLNPEYIMMARRHSAFAEAIEASGLITVDGIGVELGLRLTAPQLETDRVTGVALSWFLGELSAETGEGLFLLGAGPGIADAAGQKLMEASPGARVAGTFAEASPSSEDDAQTIERIRASGARMLLVAYGAPAQVHWIHRNLQALDEAGVRIVIGIGGALDYISGNVPWAPPVVRRLGLEWLYRLVREPWRWRRQMALPVFAGLVVRDAVVKKIRSWRRFAPN